MMAYSKQLTDFSLSERVEILSDLSRLVEETEDCDDAMGYVEDIMGDYEMSFEAAKKLITHYYAFAERPDD